MSDNKELAKEIKDFLDTYAKTAAAYDPNFDEPEDRFNGPDTSMFYAAMIALENDRPFNPVHSSFTASGCYHNGHDKEARQKHDDLLSRVNNLAYRPTMKM